jgi:hypothetical protein
MHYEFHRLPLGAYFTLNGNTYRKQSRRTGHLLSVARTFYIGAREVVRCAPHA